VSVPIKKNNIIFKDRLCRHKFQTTLYCWKLFFQWKWWHNFRWQHPE